MHTIAPVVFIFVVSLNHVNLAKGKALKRASTTDREDDRGERSDEHERTEDTERLDVVRALSLREQVRAKNTTALADSHVERSTRRTLRLRAKVVRDCAK
jgi:hypothetical protein